MAGLATLAIGSITACSMAPATGGVAQRNRVSHEELASTNSRTVYEALEMVRPQWMTGRGPVSMTDPTEARPNVYMHGNRVGDLDYLKQVYVLDVAELVYWEPGEASARFGMGNPRGVIEIIPRT
jgi:hypothetical protein